VTLSEDIVNQIHDEALACIRVDSDLGVMGMPEEINDAIRIGIYFGMATTVEVLVQRGFIKFVKPE
jgi:hypothetical protein